MERIIENISDNPNIEVTLYLNNLVFDGTYLVHKLPAIRFSFNTDNNHYGYFIFTFKNSKFDVVEYIKQNIFNPMLISDFGIGLRIISNLYKDEEGYYYFARSIMRNTIVKIVLTEFHVFMIEHIKTSISLEYGCPNSSYDFIPGFGFNANELAFISNIISINFIAFEDWRIKINAVYVDKKVTYRYDNFPVHDFYIDCTIPKSMYKYTKELPQIKEKLRFVMNIKVPKPVYKRTLKKIKDKRKDLKSIRLDNNDDAFLMQPNIPYEYIKPNDKNVIKIIGVLTGNKYEDHCYFKFDLLSNYEAFLNFFIDYLDIADVVQENIKDSNNP